MSRKAKEIMLEPRQQVELERLVRTHTTPKRMAERAQIILWGAEGQTNVEVARRLRTRVARISKWRTRFVKEGLEGLVDEARSASHANTPQRPSARFCAGLMSLLRIRPVERKASGGEDGHLRLPSMGGIAQARH